jgi:hypothetical protein
MASIQFTEADRDEHGRIKVARDEPRSLADLLPTPAAIRADAQRIVRQPPTPIEWVTLIAVALIAAWIAIYAWSMPTSPTAREQPRQTALPTLPPSSARAVERATPVRLLVAFAAPDGAPLGAIESTRAMTPTAHYGDDWIQADVSGSGRIWLRANDMGDLPIVGPDLSPRRATVAPAREAVIAPPAPPTFEPQPPCLTAGTGGQTVMVCDWLDADALRIAAAQKWVATYGGNIGTVSTPSPQVRQP